MVGTAKASTGGHCTSAVGQEAAVGKAGPGPGLEEPTCDVRWV